MMYQELSALAKSLGSTATADKETLIPPKQLLVQVLDILSAFENSKDSGLLSYLPAHFSKRHGHSAGEKHLANFIRSILRYGKDGSEIAFFARIIEKNTGREVVAHLSTAIKGLKQKHQEIMSRSEETFRKVKVSFNEVISGLTKLFKKRVEDYENIGGNNLKCRLRDYILKLHCGSNVLECSGLCYLEIVVLEATLVFQNADSGNHKFVPGQDTFRAERQTERDTQRSVSREGNQAGSRLEKRIAATDASLLLSSNKKSRTPANEKPFYGFADVLGGEVERLSVSEIQHYKDKKELERKVLAGEPRDSSAALVRSRDDSLDITIARPARKSRGPRASSPTANDRTFEELLAETQRPRDDEAFLEQSKACVALEGRLAASGEQLAGLPAFMPVIDEARRDILDALKERKEVALWMSTMLSQMPTGFLDSLDGEVDAYELEEEVAGLHEFYTKFSFELERSIGGPRDPRAVERHTIDEYYNKRPKPAPRKRPDRRKPARPAQPLRTQEDSSPDTRNILKNLGPAVARSDDEEDDIRGVELVVAEMASTSHDGRPAARLSVQSSKHSLRPADLPPADSFGPGCAPALKKKRALNERREREARLSAQRLQDDEDYRDVGDSQIEFEEHERQVYRMHGDRSQYDEAGMNTPANGESDESENEAYRRRLLASGYKKGTSANSTNSKMKPRKNFQEPEIHPEEDIRYEKAHSRSISQKSRPKVQSTKSFKRDRSEREGSNFIRKPDSEAYEEDSDTEGVSLKPRGPRTAANREFEEEYSFQVEVVEDEQQQRRGLERRTQNRQNEQFDDRSPESASGTRKYSQVIDKIRNSKQEEQDSDNYDQGSRSSQRHPRIKIKEPSREPSERRRPIRSKSHSRTTGSQAPGKSSRQPLSRVAVQANKQPQLQVPPLLQTVDSTKHENMIYKCKKRKMYISQQDFRAPDRNYLTIRQGDIVCAVMQQEAWSFVYFENNPKKFGFVPSTFIALIS